MFNSSRQTIWPDDFIAPMTQTIFILHFSTSPGQNLYACNTKDWDSFKLNDFVVCKLFSRVVLVEVNVHTFHLFVNNSNVWSGKWDDTNLYDSSIRQHLLKIQYACSNLVQYGYKSHENIILKFSETRNISNPEKRNSGAAAYKKKGFQQINRRNTEREKNSKRMTKKNGQIEDK